MSYAGDITPQQAWEILESDPAAVLVDVRTAAEWHFVGVPDVSRLGKTAVLAQWTTFPNGAANPNFLDEVREAGVRGDGPVIFLCRSGQRSAAAAEAATAAGLGPAYNIIDGFEGGLDGERHRGSTGWRAAGLPWRQS
ncbi:Rhodanese domain protein [Segniliparus rotundus DSM 44985]|uniref:Rhodanese domain protein n=1 Tax=Segniliparus rotundus (strain ATCC BAA-972 / CDC 1076 / CIP 108378 / DSM 44985 / JCM 13578) TaxID=640132 RepID=D6Z812_SEGRD|nr:rhodanese-like domain-containing protein [Segniliparus rotundus]ADG98092.1 Rhodanese domain protein [Segniliparus rotundus DSM 44985]